MSALRELTTVSKLVLTQRVPSPVHVMMAACCSAMEGAALVCYHLPFAALAVYSHITLFSGPGLGSISAKL